MPPPTPVTVQVGFFGTQNALQQMNVLGRAAQSFGSQLSSKLAGTFGAVALGAMAFTKVEAQMQKNIATAKQISSLAIKFNMDPKQVHSVKMAADDAGVSVRSLLMATKSLEKAASQGGSNRAMMENWKQLGFSAEKVNEIQAKPMKFLPEIAEKLSRISDESERNAAGALLLGRQYQQLVPLLDKLGESEEAREKFLNNQNAMTKEEVEANKEIARINSQMEESFAKMVASGAGIVSWSKAFASNLMDAAAFALDYLKTREKMKEGEATEKAGLAGGRLVTEVRAMQERKIARDKRLAAGEKLSDMSEQDISDDYYIKKHGSIEQYAANRARQAMIFAKLGKSGLPEDKVDAADVKKWAAKLGTENLEEGDQYKFGGVVEELTRIQRKNIAERNTIVERKLDDGTTTVGVRSGMTGEVSDYSPVGASYLNLISQGVDMQTQAHQTRAARGNSYMQSFSDTWGGLAGQKYDSKTQKWYSEEQHAKMMAARAKTGGADDGGALTFEDQREARKREKEKKKLDRELARSERTKKVEGASAVEKAEEALITANEDVELAKEDVAEKDDESAQLKARIEAINAAKDKFYKDKEEADKFIKQREREMGRDASDEERLSIYKSRGVDKDKEAEILSIVKSVADINKQIDEIEKERIKNKIKLNQEENKAVQAADALRNAKEQEWVKASSDADTKRKDDADFEKEERGRRHDEMRRAGKSDLEIKQDNFQAELTAYEKVMKNKEAVEADVAKRVAERKAKGLKAELTDAEKAALNKVNEEADASRKSTDAALKSMEDEGKPTVVASDLGRAGGGAVVQFGANNPADLIRKSNEYLAIIAKNSSSKEVAKAKDLVTTSFKRATPATK